MRNMTNEEILREKENFKKEFEFFLWRVILFIIPERFRKTAIKTIVFFVVLSGIISCITTVTGLFEKEVVPPVIQPNIVIIQQQQPVHVKKGSWAETH